MIKCIFLFILTAFTQVIYAQNCDLPLKTSVEVSQEEFRKIISQKEKPLTLIKKIDGFENGQDIYFYSGVPNYIKPVFIKDLKVLRHYSFHVDAIEKSKSLIAGPRPFIIPDAHERIEYVDLTGVFFTTTEFDPEKLWLGFNKKTPYIDFKVHEDFPLVALTDGNFLIPGPPSKPKWFIDAYNEFIKSGEAPSYMIEEFNRIKANGGIKKALEVPIEIIKVFRP